MSESEAFTKKRLHFLSFVYLLLLVKLINKFDKLVIGLEWVTCSINWPELVALVGQRVGLQLVVEQWSEQLAGQVELSLQQAAVEAAGQSVEAEAVVRLFVAAVVVAVVAVVAVVVLQLIAAHLLVVAAVALQLIAQVLVVAVALQLIAGQVLAVAAAVVLQLIAGLGLGAVWLTNRLPDAPVSS